MFRSLVWLAVLWPGIAAASDQRVVAVAKEFTECAGLYEALSAYIQPTDRDAAEFYRGLSRGAQLASKTLAENDTDSVRAARWAESLVANHTVYWRPLILREGITPEAEMKMGRCVELNSLQADIVQTWRDNAAGLN